MPRRRWPLAQPPRSRCPWRARANDKARRRFAAVNDQRCTFQMGSTCICYAAPWPRHDTTRPVAVARQLGGPAVECMRAAAGNAGQGVENGDCDDDDDAPATMVSIGMGKGKAWIARLVDTNGWAIAEGSSTRALGRDGRQQAQFATRRSVLRSHGDAAAVPGVWTTRLPPTWSSCASLHGDDDDDNSPTRRHASCDVLSTMVCRLDWT